MNRKEQNKKISEKNRMEWIQKSNLQLKTNSMLDWNSIIHFKVITRKPFEIFVQQIRAGPQRNDKPSQNNRNWPAKIQSFPLSHFTFQNFILNIIKNGRIVLIKTQLVIHSCSDQSNHKWKTVNDDGKTSRFESQQFLKLPKFKFGNIISV